MAEKMDEVRLVKVFLDIPLFEGLDYTRITSILKICTQRTAEPGEILCESRTIDEQLILLLGGKLKLESAEGAKLAEMIPIRIIGEMGVFTGQTRSSRVIVEESSAILELPVGKLHALIEEYPQMGHHMLVNLIKLLYTRMHDTNKEFEILGEQIEGLRTRLEELSPDDPLLA